MRNLKIYPHWNRREIQRFVIFTVLFGVTIVGYQNCDQTGLNNFESPNARQNTPLALFQGKAQLDPNCQTLKLYDSCIFLKNPISQGQRPLASVQDSDLINEFQEHLTLGVRLSGLSNPNSLQNPSFTITSATSPNASPLADGTWKFPLNDPENRLGQVMAYFYANTTMSLMQSTTGRFYAADRGIHIVVDAQQTGWSASNNQIDLQRVGQNMNMAFDASILVFLLGEANLYYATQGQIDNLVNDQNHVNCGPPNGSVYVKDCCTSKNGCSRAIAAGTSDYLSALVFPDSPTVGELLTNRVSGMGFCGVSRDLRQTSSLTADQAYTACDGASGEIYVEGTLYASIWWEIRKQVAELGAAKVALFDQLYMNHLASISSRDTFLTVLTKIQSLDNSLTQGIFYPFFTAEYQRRNLL